MMDKKTEIVEYAVVEMPYEVFQLFCESSESIDLNAIREAVRHALASKNLNGKTILLRPMTKEEINKHSDYIKCLNDIDPFGNITDPINDASAMLRSLQRAVADCIAELGHVVLNLQLDKRRSQVKSGIQIIDNNPYLLWKELQDTDVSGIYNVSLAPMEHPNLARERVIKLSSCHVITIVRHEGNVTNLGSVALMEKTYGVNILSSTMKVRLLLDGMRGCNFLHEHGIIHCDFRPDNVLVVPRNGRLVGMLNDFEGSAPFGTDWDKSLFSYEYDEKQYYLSSQLRKSDRQRDIFSWGISIIDLFDYEKLYNFFQTRRTWDLGNEDRKRDLWKIVEEILKDRVSPAMVELVKRMVGQDVAKRPTFSEVEACFQKIIHG